MSNTFFLGTYPGLTKEMFSYAEGVLESFVQDFTNFNEFHERFDD